MSNTKKQEEEEEVYNIIELYVIMQLHLTFLHVCTAMYVYLASFTTSTVHSQTNVVL